MHHDERLHRLHHHNPANQFCPWCGDPLAADGKCDCAGDPDRDARDGTTGLRSAHELVIRRGGREKAEEVWI